MQYTDQNFLNFMQFFSENLANLYAGASVLEGWLPPLREILDPPLFCLNFWAL